MEAPTAAAVSPDLPVRASTKITFINPVVATISDRKSGGVSRSVLPTLIAASPNRTFASIAPRMHPMTCAGM